MANNTPKLQNDIRIDITEDVLSVSSCHTMVGMAKMILMPLRKLLGAIVTLRNAGISKDLVFRLICHLMKLLIIWNKLTSLQI